MTVVLSVAVVRFEESVPLSAHVGASRTEIMTVRDYLSGASADRLPAKVRGSE